MRKEITLLVNFRVHWQQQSPLLDRRGSLILQLQLKLVQDQDCIAHKVTQLRMVHILCLNSDQVCAELIIMLIEILLLERGN